MERDLVQDYLMKAGVKQEQAEALSRIFAEMATKSDLLGLEHKMISLEQRMEARFDAFRAEIKSDLSCLETRLTTKMIAAIVVLATVLSLLDLFRV